MGIILASILIKYRVFEDLFKESPHSDPTVDVIPSPSSEPEFFIQSVLETGDLDIPLVSILKDLVTINCLELYFYIILIFILVYKYIYKFNLGFIYKHINKYMPNKFPKDTPQKLITYNDRFMTILMFIIIIFLVLLKLFLI